MVNERTQIAGFALWLAMLGVARTQSLPTDNDTPPFSTLYKWKYVDFEFPSEMHRQYALANGDYVPENCLPLGLEVWGSRIFVSLPSWRKGIPATLTTVSRTGGVTSPLLKPFPNWSYHRAYSAALARGAPVCNEKPWRPLGLTTPLQSPVMMVQDNALSHLRERHGAP